MLLFWGGYCSPQIAGYFEAEEKFMKLFDWRPGLSGLICLPQEGSLPGQKPRLYFIAVAHEPLAHP
jgi:hypothetical protein